MFQVIYTTTKKLLKSFQSHFVEDDERSQSNNNIMECNERTVTNIYLWTDIR